MKEKMIKVFLYDNGYIEIESTESGQMTQYMWFANEKGRGDVYYCKKGMESFYLKRMLLKRKKEIAKQIKELKAIETRLDKKLFDLKGE